MLLKASARYSVCFCSTYWDAVAAKSGAAPEMWWSHATWSSSTRAVTKPCKWGRTGTSSLSKLCVFFVNSVSNYKQTHTDTLICSSTPQGAAGRGGFGRDGQLWLLETLSHGLIWPDTSSFCNGPVSHPTHLSGGREWRGCSATTASGCCAPQLQRNTRLLEENFKTEKKEDQDDVTNVPKAPLHSNSHLSIGNSPWAWRVSQ